MYAVLQTTFFPASTSVSSIYTKQQKSRRGNTYLPTYIHTYIHTYVCPIVLYGKQHKSRRGNTYLPTYIHTYTHTHAP